MIRLVISHDHLACANWLIRELLPLPFVVGYIRIVFFLPHFIKFIEKKRSMPFAKKKSTDRFGSRKASKAAGANA